jgi:dolichyl-phosphate-mannose--protein O-mannosyl transferase
LLMAAFANIPRKKLAIYGLTFVMAMVGVYVSQYSRGLMLAMQPASPLDVFKDTQRLLDHHAALTDMKNPWTSGWVTWALPTKPVLLRYAQHMGEVRVLSGLGNLALWWPGILVTVAAIASILAKGVIAIVGPVSDDLDTSPSVSVSAFVQARGRSVLLLLSGCIGFLAPWVVTHRDSYIYHFLPCYLAIVLLLAGYVDWVRKRKPLEALIFLGVVLVVAAFYAPVWTSMATSAEAVQARLFLGSWR